MTTTKLVSANMGIVLVVERDGKQEKHEFSVICPSESAPMMAFLLGEIIDYINEQFETNFHLGGNGTVYIVKPRKTKAPRAVSQKEFNSKIKGLGYEAD